MGAAKFCISFRAAAAELLSHVKYMYFYRSIDSAFAHASVSECSRECV